MNSTATNESSTAPAPPPPEQMETSARYERAAASSRQTVKRIFIAWVIGMLIAASIAVPARLVNRDATLGGITYGTWGVVIAVEVTAWPVARLLVEIFVRIVTFALRNHRRVWRTLHQFNETRVQLTYALWSMFFLASFEPLIQAQPLPPWEDTPQQPLWFATRILAVNFLLSLLLIIRRVYLVRLSMGKRVETYAADVRVSMLRQDLLQWLTRDMPDTVLTLSSRHMRAARNARNGPTPERKSPAHFLGIGRRRDGAGSTTPNLDGIPEDEATKEAKAEEAVKLNEAARRLQRFFRKTLAEAEAPSSQLARRSSKNSTGTGEHAERHDPVIATQIEQLRRHRQSAVSPADDDDEDDETETFTRHLLAAFDDVRGEPHRVCRGLSRLSTSKRAKRLGRALYERDRGTTTHVKLATFLAPIRKRGTAEHVVAMLDLLSDENDTPPARLTEGHIVKVMDRIYHERKNLSLSLLNLESITNALAGFLTGAVVIVTILLLNIVFATGELAEVAITVSSAILGLSFIFATSAQHTFDSFVFLFVRHPYDVGDRILLQGYDPMDVVKMELLHTTFRKWDGFILTLPNYALQSISIFNYKRSGPMTQPLAFMVDMDTPKDKLDAFEKRFFDHLAKYPAWFDTKTSNVFYRDVTEANKLTLCFYAAHRNNFANGEHVQRQDGIIRTLKVALDDLEIKYHTNTTRGVFLPSQGLGPEATPGEGASASAEAMAQQARTAGAVMSATHVVNTRRI